MKPSVDRRVMELQEQLKVLLEQHQRLQERLSEEQERKRTLQEAVKRDQTVIVELEVKLKEQEEKLQESLSASRDLQERKERMQQEEDRLGQLGAATERLRASLKERERQLAAREGQECKFVETSFIGSGFNMKTPHLESKKRAEIQDLRVIRDQLVRERQELDDKLHDQKCLNSDEERRMIELDESVEAIDGAIEYKNDVICGKNVEYDSTYRGDDILMQRLVKLEVAETRAMLHRYFVKVLDLRMEGKWMEDNFKEVEEQYADPGKCTRDLHHSLQRSKLDCERRLLAQQREYQ